MEATPRGSGAGDPFDYTCIRLNLEADVEWLKHYANPRGYSLSQIRNELYGIEVGSDGVYMFGGSGDESNYSAINPPFPSSDVWVGWVLAVDVAGDVLRSDVFSHGNVNSATEYGALVEGGYVIFNDTDAGGDTEVGVMKVLNGSNPAGSSSCPKTWTTTCRWGWGTSSKCSGVWVHVRMYSRRGRRWGGQRDRRSRRHFCVWERLPLNAST